MKITKSQLMQIIKEETSSLNEMPYRQGGRHAGYDANWRRTFGEPDPSQKDTEAQAIADMDVGIAREFAQDVVEFVRQNVASEQAPALAEMSMGDFLRLAADLAGDEPLVTQVGE